MSADLLLSAFTSGEWDPALHYRRDLERRANAAVRIENAIVRPRAVSSLGPLPTRWGVSLRGLFFDIMPGRAGKMTPTSWSSRRVWLPQPY
jgi:hypothetical protein